MSDTTKRWISGGFFSIFVLGIISIGLFGVQNPVYATDTEAIFAGGEAAAGAAEGSCLTAGATPAVCPATGIKESLNVVGGKIVSPAFRIALIQALLNLSQFVLNRLAYEAAVAIASGGPGEESLFYQQKPAEAFAQLGLEVAGEAVGMLSELTTEELGIEFNLCAPSSDLLNLALAIGIKQKYQPSAPKCDILEVGKNWSGMFANLKQTFTDPDAVNDAILSKFAESLKPGKNELSATLRINIAIDQKVHEQKLLQFLQQNEREYKPVTDFITGNVKTPSETLQGDFESKLKEVNGDQSKIQVGELVNAGELIGGLALSTASTFTNTLLSQLMSRIYTGLFETDPLPNPFDLEAVGGGDKSSAQERFASIIATNPIATAEYNALSEFVVCTAQGVTNRGLNNCVMDVNFLAAVSRGNAGTAITVQEAIDEGLLNGNWPLISPENEPANQDPYCYTYGYCYGNVVKLRKARVLPIGWELAALRNSEGNPATLQEVIDGFNDCTEDGTIGPSNASDSSTKWCHLIDPNWVLKYPDSQCRAIANGEVRLSNLSPGRNSTCVDAPSCIGEDNDGNCTDGYGYCVQEKNVWRFRGDECPEEYATCLSFQNTETGDAGDFLVNTVDYSVCDDDNAGCRWYRTNKYYEDGGTADDTSDDSYEWLPEGDTYTTADRDDDWNYQDGGVSVSRETYSYTSDSGETYSYTSYAYEDRLYLTHNATECSDNSAGCTQLYEFDTDVYLNGVQNPSFEDDEDSDGVPDGWIELTGSTYYELDTSDSKYGSTSARVSPSLFSLYQQDVNAVGNNFYTFSIYFKAETSGDSGVALLVFLDEDGNELDARGTSSSGDCSWNSTNLWYAMIEEPSTTEFERFECLVTTPTDTAQIRLYVGNSSLHSPSLDDVYIDAVQLELGEDANTFAVGYSTTPMAVYYKIAPDYLGCTGGANDPAECDGYAQVCSAQDVGCNLYAPEDGDPSVPAIISELDQCPSECVGYTTYKQEATDYESEDFPLYFIATSASSCSAQYVGCDSYTNLASVEAGGEGTEYYMNLRSCLTEDIADGDSGQVPSTYFTWEGSDNEGYQLQTWYLLESNYSGAKDTFDGSGFEETSPELAPCTNIVMNSPNEVLCRDSNAEVQTNVWGNDSCDEHDDIFENPDCREFFDTEGNIHYRQYADTISISDACTPYRKDSGEETDCEDSGGYWTEQGFCRYYVLPEESTDCPAEQNGCREYTGGAGRNASTILSDTFEGGTYEDFAIADTATSSASSISSYISKAPSRISVSNESVATEGHSLYVLAPSTGIAGIETIQISNATTYDAETPSTCSGTVSDAGCDLTTDNDGDGSDDESCTVSNGSDSCGTLAGSLVAGKTFVLDFWAKGNGNLYVTLEEEGGSGDAHDFVNPTAVVTTLSSLTPVELDGSWALYSLGPLDTSSYDAFDETAVLRFAISAGGEFYIDNITLKQVEENLTLIKDSWVVPSTCDQTPGGVDSDQYYLGCEAYTDQHGSDVDLYQFSDLCSEEVVGCEGFFDTGNSDSAYQQVFNARCVYSTDASYDLTDGEVVGSNTACIVNDIKYCTISTGRSYCTFDAETVFESPLPIDTSGTSDFAIVYGPETAVVSGDTPVYIVADDAFACTSRVMGCQEVGEPTYSQDQGEVESFESVYYINLPGDYDNILCEHEALFCEEWSSTQDGNFYFKDPLDKSCEYKSTVTIENRSYFGWFRTGTTEPCYWEDKNGDGEYTRAGDEAYLVAGEEFSVWRNGDADDGDDDLWDYYDGWVASCEGKYDLCTEFIDVVDTGGGLNDYGQSYYFTNDELLSEDNLTDNQRCNGQVSQKFGCALFNNTTDSKLRYNTSASYVTAVHADVIYGTEENDLVDPISCTTEEGGVFTVSESSADLIGLSGQTLDVCARRCVYEVENEDRITTDLAQQVEDVDTAFLERSCLFDTDCPTLTTYFGEDVSGSCANTDQALTDLGSGEEADDYYLVDDANEVLKVNRDRTCSAWLACESSRTSWNTSTNKYDTICDSINLCVEGSQQGDRAICSEWNESDPEILTAYQYSNRDVSWSGFEYSGNTIPNQLPIETYDQFNIAPQTVCVDETAEEIMSVVGDPSLPMACATFEDCGTDPTESCVTDADCTAGGYGACDDATGTCFYACENQTAVDYRLVHNAGPCDYTEEGDGNGGACTVGHCSETGVSCVDSDDCSGDEECVIGYLQVTGALSCGNDDCSCNPDNNDPDDQTNTSCSSATSAGGIATRVCDPVQFICVDELTSEDNEDRDACIADVGERICVPASTSTVGSCFNNRCLSDIVDENGDGKADRLTVGDAREQACRAYPEVDSPFPIEVVSQWINRGTPEASPSDKDSTPYSFVNGFQDSTVCALDEDGEVTECDCSYDKAKYASGAGYRYYGVGTGIEGVPEGICSGGPWDGITCVDDTDCTDGSKVGTCSYLSRVDTVYGWAGYCIEKDSSIQTLGSSNADDQACLTWLPVDQLTGATDLYAKYTSAGFAPQDTYYCAEVAVGYTVGTSSIACAEVQDNNCNDGSSNWAKFRNEADNSSGGQDDCIAGVWCPDGFFAVMTGCGSLDTENYCTAGVGGDDDCPYFCVPKLSYKTSDNETLGAYAGDPCTTPGTALGISVDSPSHPESSTSEVEDDTNNGAYYVNTSAVGDHWAGSRAPNIRVYVLPPTDFANARAFYNDCEARGVLNNLEEFTYSEYTAYQSGSTNPGVEDLIGSYGTGTFDRGFRNLTNDFVPGAVCSSVVKVSTKTLADEEQSPFQTYNGAWTNRLWEEYTGRISSDAYFGYYYSTASSPYGSAANYLDLELEIDPAPHALVMCKNSDDYSEVIPTVALACSSGDLTSASGADARAYMDVSISADSEVFSDNCLYEDCDCNDGGTRNTYWCNYDADLGATISCGNGACETSTGTACTFTDTDGDGYDNACAGDTERCIGTCIGGPADSTVCSEDSGCFVNTCYGTFNDDGLTSAFCRAADDAPSFALSTEEPEDVIARLSELFGRIYGIVAFTDDGYGDVSNSSFNPTNAESFTTREPLGTFDLIGLDEYAFNTYSDWEWDTRGQRSNAQNYVPVVRSIGECEGTTCYEGVEGKFSVNDVDGGTVEGEGSKRATIAFFTYADSDQMPIRRIVVDWGDDFSGLTDDMSWPTGSQSGSTAPDNFYKNHRGLNSTSDTQECSDSGEEFGDTLQACSESYVAFTHDYICTAGRIAQLSSSSLHATCEYDDDDGRLLNSPCVSGNSCVFQPRVHVIDNWGWCTGFCDTGEDGTDGCYSGVTDLADRVDQDECNIEFCPSGNNPDSICEDKDGGTTNPWINFAGTIEILAE